MPKQMTEIAKLLPNDISETTLNEIANLINNQLVSEIRRVEEELTTKVMAFLKGSKEAIKESALAELEMQEDTYRNAKLFESVRELMSVELNANDEDRAISTLTVNQMQIEEENEVLTDEINKLITENTQLTTVVKALSDKVDLLTEQKKALAKKVKLVEESSPKPFKSSEKAIVTGNADVKIKASHPLNDFLTEEVMKFMPQKDKK